MPDIFLLDSQLDSRFVTIRGEKARYLVAVLRCGAGALLTLKDDSGNIFSARIITATKKEVQVEILGKQERDTESALQITSLQGLLKGEKMDLVVQKVTELGVREIIPVVTERSQVRETRKVQRWRRIAEEASRQAGRNTIPVVRDIVGLQKLFIDYHVPSGIIFWEKRGIALTDVLAKFGASNEIALFTGPEGGFSESEIEAVSKNGFVPATLGKRILRAETASIAAVAIAQFALGDLGIKEN
jgi:16S rRNA (uracil1498-N3)-methyltransferase